MIGVAWRFGALSIALSLGVAAVAEPSFVPVYQSNFPDPFVLPTKTEFIAYSTNDGINLPMATSRDLVHWSAVLDPARAGKRLDGMPVLASWVQEGRTWAPEVLAVGDHYLLFYTAHHRRLDKPCVGVAVASDAHGPFRDTSAEPLVCQTELGGTIDADAFRDADGKLYLYFKNDGNGVGKSSAIWGQRLSDDGMSLIGQPIALARGGRPWEQKLIEAPSMVRSPSGYQLFYSGGYYGWNPDQNISPYAIGYATCTSPLGPCADAGENPILHSFKDRQAGCISGPGHQAIFQAAGRSFIAFHAWAATRDCRKAADERYLYVAPLSWQDGKPVIGMSLRVTARP
ncbi:MAG: glycoside hydrolase family 43 protein [Sphingomicrobium sp.]|nr:glycoside hydrolase family 43 protein [Sphingomonadales bacterium]